MVAAVNQTLQKALEENPKVLICGEDIEDPKGGVFGLTKGLSSRFPHQVFNSALAEATILGTAVGLASVGWKPVFEIQFIDFICPAINQLMTQVASLRWRTCGDWACPWSLSRRMGPTCRRKPLALREQRRDLAHIHGLNVVIPAQRGRRRAALDRHPWQRPDALPAAQAHLPQARAYHLHAGARAPRQGGNPSARPGCDARHLGQLHRTGGRGSGEDGSGGRLRRDR